MPTSDQFRQTLRSGTRVVIVVQIASQLVTLGVLAVLYRQLGPKPYGLLGMVVPLLALLRVFIAGGLDVAAIQRSELSDEQVSALFWFNQILGVATALIAIAVAPWMVWFYDEKALAGLTVALAGTSVAVALGTQHQALLQRKMRLGSLAVIRLAAQACGGLAAIAAAAAQWGVWALVVQQYGELVLLAVLAWQVEPWRPGWNLRRTGTRPLVRFGGYYTLSSLMFFLTANADKVLIGRVLGPVALGLYGQAFNLVMKPVHIMILPLSGVMLPALSRIAADRRQYGNLLMGFFRAIGLVMLPASLGMMLVADEAMRVLGGLQWIAAGPLVAALGAVILVQGFFNALGSVFASAGRPRRLFFASALIALAMGSGFVVGLTLGQYAGAPVLGVALSYSLTMILVVFPPYMLYCLRTMGLSWQMWLAQLRTAALATVGMGLVVATCHWLLSRVFPLSAPVLLAVEIGTGALSYALLARREIGWLIALGRGDR